MSDNDIKFFTKILGGLILVSLLPLIYPIIIVLGICALIGVLPVFFFHWWENQNNKPAETSRPAPPPNPNPYSLKELQNHLDNYCRKALRNGDLDKWKYGRDYERYIGYLYERNGWKVIYNGAVEGNFDGGIDLICYKNNECCVIQCKRWKNAVGVEYIEKFKNAVERFQRYNFKFGEVTGVFQTTSDYTDDAYSYAEKYEIDCYVNDFKSIKEYPPVKCLVRNGEKVYYLPFDKEFDRISVENGCAYKFKVADAEKAGYHYHLNRDVLLKIVPLAPRPKPQPLPMVNHYWNSDKNYPVAYFHADYFEYVDLKSCKIHSHIDGCFTFSAKYIKISPLQKGFTDGKRLFKYGLGLPQVYQNNRWTIIPIYRNLKGGEGYLSYIENQKMYAYTMFKIVYHELFGKEYQDGCKHGWHYDKGYPEYR